MGPNQRLLYPPKYDRSKEVPLKDFHFIHPLQIDDMIILIKESHRGLSDLALKDYFTTDTDVLSYRLAIVEDLVNNPALYEVFCESINMIHNIHDLRRAMNSDFSIESALSSIRYLEMYQEIIDLFANGLEGLTLHSEGMIAFRDTVFSISKGEDYENLRKELAKMNVHFGGIKSVTIGLNLDETLRVKEAGIISIQEKPFHAGTLMEKLLKRNPLDTNSLISPLYPLTKGLHGEDLKALNYSIRSSFNTIFSKSIRDFEPTLQKYFSVNTSYFTALLDDIRFLTAGVKFILSMKEKGFPMCRPEIVPIEEKKCDLTDVYNPILARKSIEQSIVSNSFTFDENGRFYLVTGPNHGGKSIFAYSIGMAQALFQLGLFVPAKKALMSPVTGIFTHFPSSDENNYGKGRLESECARLSEVLKKLSDTDLLLMDESFSSTSGLEAGYIASEVLTGIGVIGCGGIFVTHIHDLPQQITAYNAHPDNKGKIDNLSALMENKEDGIRSYKIIRTTPDGLSYAKDIAGRYGLDLESIIKKP
ncbi:MAG: hypothetical protein IJN92_09075 [Lachnospiraceae bacterium]|nr:hypothetical protein [Lachnospiraceae bacterium]